MERTNIKLTNTNNNNNIIPSTQNDVNVIESLKKYNQSQIEKMVCVDNDTSTLDDGDVVGGGGGEATTHVSESPERPEPAAIAKTVVCLLCTLFLLHVINN